MKGIYRDGKVELEEAPQGVEEARVLITFLPDDTAPAETPAPRMITFGMFKGAWKPTTEEDFRAAEWRGEGEPDAG